ncbi:MAG: Gfo/Idh/MocA family oxidoreductase, partial [Acidobacteria bacterium]|nr:Gfo/Idh/MocA family oxidoreductase [Acidobacteriota bacterium]
MNEQENSVRRPRLGFLGTGWIGQHRMRRIRESGMAEIAFLCDTSAEMLAQARQAVPDVRVTSTFEELLRADLDGVVIATPSALHAEQTMRALERGIAVFCQKPLGRNAGEVAEVIRAAQSANKLLAVDLSYRFTQGMKKIVETLSAGDIGDVYAGDLVFHNAYGPDKAWFYDPRLSGGGCVIDLGIHLVDLALWALGFPQVNAISSYLFAAGKPIEEGQVEDYATVTLQLSSGAVVRIACSWRLAVGSEAVISAAFYGTHGGLEFRNVNGSFYDFVAEQFRGTSRTILASPPDNWGGRAAIAWATQLGSNSSFDPAVGHLTDVAGVLDEIYIRGRKNPRHPGQW